ncbi:CoA pyrophosphatase [Sinomonas sp. ASV322]|uniref:NUDIX hydrolase n=1 Tax=Sinomonas sp. ASV322 TaxID=3041920 RepID=UPI0027DD6E52|nr:CoA pyrophosphatase [Sinomonas sp. ASV322]MDQ4503795.1 CoA pyrophosphatase [Sinomonas sp. ASV322]
MSARAQLESLAAGVRSGELDPFDPRWHPKVVGHEAREAAVLVLFGTLDGAPMPSDRPLMPADLDVLLLERAQTLGAHPGQVAFPGGSREPQDANLVDCALREAVEETGLDPAGVDVLAELPALGLGASGFLVTPVLAWWAAPSPVDVVDFAESARVFRTPIRDLLDPANRVTAVVQRRGATFASPAFEVSGVLVWGFTAMVLDALLEGLGWSLPWDRERKLFVSP